MKTGPLFALLIGLVFFDTSSTQAQFDPSTATARAGVIRNLWQASSAGSEGLWSFYPEIQIGGAAFVPFLSWGFSWGYWSVDPNRVLEETDNPTYSYSSHIVCLRIDFSPQVIASQIPIPIDAFVGLSGHYVKSEYLGGTDMSGNPGRNSITKLLIPVIGLGIFYPVLRGLTFELQARQYVPVGGSAGNQAQKNRRAFTLGASTTF